ncbi:MAG: ParA family protein [Blastocatellia bacterium]|nr:ParA family protein [Blastocatellia bacterium]
MRVIAIANQKGGVGKTTTTVNLAGGLVVAGFRVCVVDCDPQAHATFSLYDRELIDYSLTDVILPPKSVRESGRKVQSKPQTSFLPTTQALFHTSVANLDLLPADIRLSRIEKESVMAADRLARVIREVGSLYDFVLVDTPPSLGSLFTGALKGSTHLIIPVSPGPLPLEGLVDLLDSRDEIVELTPPGLEPIKMLGVLMSLFDSRNNTSRETRNMVTDNSELGKYLFNTNITINSRLSEVAGEGVPIYFSPRPSQAVEKAKQQFDDLVDEVLQRLQVTPQNRIKRVK